MSQTIEASKSSSLRLSIIAAYMGVILIWSTTPLAIVWSDHAAGFVFGVGSRMILGAVLALLCVFLMRERLPWHHRARLAYLYGGLGIYGSMSMVYWGAQFVPSGWIALLFGLSPFFSAYMAMLWLDGERLTRSRIVGMFLGFAGLVVAFWESLYAQTTTLWAVAGILLAALIQSAAAVWVKRVDAQLPAISMTAGSLCVAAPLFLITWWLQHDASQSLSMIWQQAPNYALLSIAYLAALGSVLGFALYFHVLRHVEATKVALITLMTPISALYLGHILNHETLNAHILSGTLLVLSGLLLFIDPFHFISSADSGKTG